MSHSNGGTNYLRPSRLDAQRGDNTRKMNEEFMNK